MAVFLSIQTYTVCMPINITLDDTKDDEIYLLKLNQLTMLCKLKGDFYVITYCLDFTQVCYSYCNLSFSIIKLTIIIRIIQQFKVSVDT